MTDWASASAETNWATAGRFRRPDPAGRLVWWDGVSHVVTPPICLDHLNAVGPLTFRWTTWFTKYGGPTELKWSNRTQVVQAGRPRHDMRDAVPPCGTRRRGGAGTKAPEPPPLHPARPRRPARRSRRARLPPAHPEATRAGHHDRPRAPAPLTTPRITPGERAQNHSPNSLHNIASRKCDRTPAE